MARRPAFAKAAPSWRSSVDLPMPGSPPMSSAEPGTTPPPVTRSSSARPVGMRAIWGAPLTSVSRATARPLEARAMPEPGGAVTSASSLSVFQAPHAAHLPAQREAAEPQFWHTNWLLAGFTIGLGSLIPALERQSWPGNRIAQGAGGALDLGRLGCGLYGPPGPARAGALRRLDPGPLIHAITPLTQTRQQLVADGAGSVRQIVDRDTVPHHLNPSAAAGEFGGDLGHIGRDEIHGHAADDGHRIVPDVADRTGFAGSHAQGPQKPVRIAHRDGGDARGLGNLVGGAIADGLTWAHLAHLQDLGSEPHHRLHGIGLVLVRSAAVERNAGPHEIKMIGRTQEQAAGVGKACRRGRKLGAQRFKAQALAFVHGVLAVVRTGQMAHDERGLEGR